MTCQRCDRGNPATYIVRADRPDAVTIRVCGDCALDAELIRGLIVKRIPVARFRTVSVAEADARNEQIRSWERWKK